MNQLTMREPQKMVVLHCTYNPSAGCSQEIIIIIIITTIIIIIITIIIIIIIINNNLT
jgi:hypothetical protein